MIYSWILHKHSLLKKRRKILTVFLIIHVVIATSYPVVAENTENIAESFIDYPILTQKRLELMKKYAQRHYGLETYSLHQPQMIVVHYTAVPSLEQTLQVFKPDYIPSHRGKLATYGEVNVGSHFVIDSKGKTFSLIPTTVMARHVIGYNHVAIGIENVAGTEEGLTEQQLETNAKLIAYLVQKHPSIKYMIGHLEYMNRSYPHFKLYTAKDPFYDPYVKIDPGLTFMRKLRNLLKTDYGIELEK